MATIAQAFSQLGIAIDDKKILEMEKLVIGFETRHTHAIALGSQSLGVHPIAFIDADRAALFDVFQTSESRVRESIRQAPNINITHKVASDPFNLLCVWLLHLAVIYIQNERVRERFQLNVAKYLHYRFFTSLVKHHLPHGANESVMTAVVNSLTRKFDIVIYKSWRKTIEARCLDLISKEGLHYHTIETASPDAKLLYVLSDTQTRIRDKINTICELYYQYHKQGITIGSRAATDTDLEGEKIVVAKNSIFDTAITNMTVEILNLHQFVERQSATEVAGQFPAVSPSMLCTVLAEWSTLATSQTKNHELDFVKKTPDGEIYIGARALITAIIQNSFRYCLANKIPITNKSQVWTQLKNLYSSSRVMTPEILAIKQSVGYFVESIGRTSRESTKASLRLALIMYVLYRCFRYI